MSELDELHPDLQALVGTVLHERYRIDGLLGRGGMGAVFKGHHLGLRRDVAIKVVHPEIGRDSAMGKRFEREAHSVSRLDHPNCVRVTDFGSTEGDIRYLVMELLEGEELEASMGSAWPPERAIETTIQILEGLEHAHHAGVVHRDLKPENVFLTRDHRGRELVKLVDFGIAKLIDDEGTHDKLTRAGMVFGTPRYMSPEQASGGKLDERTDLYAAGLLLYEMLCGQPPFRAEDAGQLLRMHILAPVPELPKSVPAGLSAVVNKLLEKSRGDRYASAREAIGALEQARAGIGADGASEAGAAAVAAVPVATPGGPTAAISAPAPGPAGAGHPPAAPSAASSALVSPAASVPGAPGAATGPLRAPDAATQPLSTSGPLAAPTQYAPLARQTHGSGSRDRPRWLPWVVGAGFVLLMLMAFGAWQAARDSSERDSGEDGEAAAAAGGPTAVEGGETVAGTPDREREDEGEAASDEQRREAEKERREEEKKRREEDKKRHKEDKKRHKEDKKGHKEKKRRGKGKKFDLEDLEDEFEFD